jgi:hypothetical protein
MSISEKIMKILDDVAAKNEEQQRLEESGQPFVGIFYWIDEPGHEELLWEGEYARLVEPRSGVRDYWRTHQSYWIQTVSKIRPELRSKDYKYYPRGRVIQLEDGKFEIYADRHVSESSSILSEIRSEFRLPYDVKAFTDGRHYQCHVCTGK